MSAHTNAAHPTLVPLAMQRLSVVIPVIAPPLPIEGPQERIQALRAVHSVLTQFDPMGTEVVVVAEEGSSALLEQLRETHSEDFRQGRLTWVEAPRSGDRARLKNLGAASSRGTFLTFLDPRDEWLPGRLSRLEGQLKSHDLILACAPDFGVPSDWIRTLVRENFATPSSAVFRRSLFELTSGFPEGYEGFPLPTRVPGESEYELILLCLEILVKAEKRSRLLVTAQNDVRIGDRSRLLPTAIQAKLQKLKERITLIHVGPKLPKKYWGSVVKRLLP